MQFSHSCRCKCIIAAIILPLFYSHEAGAVGIPPPSDGPPPPVLTSIELSGPSTVEEGASAQYSCLAKFSDSSSQSVTSSWSENSSYASVSSSGLLTTGDVLSNQTITISATYQGKSDSQPVTIQNVQPELLGISISGPGYVMKGSSARYACIASYSDGTSQDVPAAWDVDSLHASIDLAGLLIAGDVDADETISVTASFNGISDTYPVILNAQPSLLGISISGPGYINEGSSAQYTCIASYSDGISQNISAAWGEDSSHASIDFAGLLVAGDVDADETISVTASFNGISETYPVTLKQVPSPVVLTGITILGPMDIYELESTSFICQATYSDGTSKTVNPVWSEDALLASIDATGVLVAGNFDADATVNVKASFNGKEAEHAVLVWMVGSQVSYPLNGFAGKRVKARLYDNLKEEWHDLGEFDSPDELVIDNVNPDQWYWISILESNSTSGVWNEVHANWLSM